MGARKDGRDQGRRLVLLWASMRPIGSTYHRLRGGLIASIVVTLALLPASAAASTLLISGAGNGHGVGMSQQGALGYARHGWGYQAILAHYYTGTTLGQAPAKAVVKVLVGANVVRVPLERYVRGVVAAEMPSNWPLAALEAQAIASRTYALTAHAGGSKFDVYSDTRSQVYVGVAAETAQSNAAVAATTGQIVLYGGQPATTYFFASSGGMTESIENAFLGAPPQPWLRAVADPYDSGPPSTWATSMTFTSATKRLKGLLRGALRGIVVLKRGTSPRIISAEVLGTRGATVVSGPELDARLRLVSTWLSFSVKRGARVKREPDRSGKTPAAAPSPSSTPAPPTGPQGGAPAPGAPATAARTGGAAAE